MFALGFWPWSVLAQPASLPERVLAAATEAIVDHALGGWGSPSTVFPPDVRSAYVDALRHPARLHTICEEYRTAAAVLLSVFLGEQAYGAYRAANVSRHSDAEFPPGSTSRSSRSLVRALFGAVINLSAM
jgi:hypothetical protein